MFVASLKSKFSSGQRKGRDWLLLLLVSWILVSDHAIAITTWTDVNSQDEYSVTKDALELSSSSGDEEQTTVFDMEFSSEPSSIPAPIWRIDAASFFTGFLIPTVALFGVSLKLYLVLRTQNRSVKFSTTVRRYENIEMGHKVKTDEITGNEPTYITVDAPESTTPRYENPTTMSKQVPKMESGYELVNFPTENKAPTPNEDSMKQKRKMESGYELVNFSPANKVQPSNEDAPYIM